MGFRAFVLFTLLVGSIQGHCGSISGTINLDSTWYPEIYLSQLNSFDELNTVSDDLIIASVPISADGSFRFQLLTLIEEDRVYRLHIRKYGDPISTIIIGGKEQNHVHFIMKRGVSIQIIPDENAFLFQKMSILGYPPNESLLQILTLKNNWRKNNSRDDRERDFLNDQFREQLKAIADSTLNFVVALYAIDELEKLGDFEMEQTWLESRKELSSPYLDNLRKEFEFMKFEVLPANESNWKQPLIIALTFILFVLLMFYIRSRRTRELDTSSLTVKERQVFETLQKGMSNKEIAAQMNVEESTIKSHVNNIFSKLGVKSRAQILDLKLKP